MTMEEFRKTRGMPFVKRGMRVRNTRCNRFGRIAGANRSANLNIRFDNEVETMNCHPTWMMTYFDKAGDVIAEYQD